MVIGFLFVCYIVKESVFKESKSCVTFVFRLWDLMVALVTLYRLPFSEFQFSPSQFLHELGNGDLTSTRACQTLKLKWRTQGLGLAIWQKRLTKIYMYQTSELIKCCLDFGLGIAFRTCFWTPPGKHVSSNVVLHILSKVRFDILFNFETSLTRTIYGIIIIWIRTGIKYIWEFERGDCNSWLNRKGLSVLEKESKDQTLTNNFRIVHRYSRTKARINVSQSHYLHDGIPVEWIYM